MKAIKVFLIIIVVFVLLIVVGLGVFIATFDLDKYRQTIAQEASRSIGRDVVLGKLALSLSFKEGVRLRVDGVSISEKEEYGIEKSFEVGAVMLKLLPQPFFTKRQIVVAEVSVAQPSIHVVRLEDGRINLQELAASATTKENTNSEGASSTENIEAAASPSAGPTAVNLLVEKVAVTDARIHFSDRNSKNPMDVTLQDLDVMINEFRLDKPFGIDVKAALFSPTQNISFAGLVGINQESGEVMLSDAVIGFDIGAINLEELQKNVPQVKAAGLEKPLSGKIEINLPKVNAGAAGLTLLTGNIRFIGGEVKTAQLPIPVKNISLEAQITEKNLTIQRLFAGIETGEIIVDGVVEDYMTVPKYQTQVSVNRLPIQALVPPGQLPVEINGGLSAKLKLNGRGAGEDAIKNLTVEGQTDVSDGKIVGINVMKEVLSKISMIPGAYEKVIAALPEDWHQRLQEKDTVFDKVDADFQFKDSTVSIKSMEAASHGFLLKSQATVNLTMDMNWTGGFYIPADFSEAVTKSVPEFGYLTDEEKRIYFPLTPYRGKADKFKTYPDLEYIGKRVIVQKGQDEIKKAIFKALDLEDKSPEAGTPNDQSPANDGAQPSQGDASSQESPEKVIIENVLDTIFEKIK